MAEYAQSTSTSRYALSYVNGKTKTLPVPRRRDVGRAEALDTGTRPSMSNEHFPDTLIKGLPEPPPLAPRTAFSILRAVLLALPMSFPPLLLKAL